jgi:hypothetical protein
MTFFFENTFQAKLKKDLSYLSYYAKARFLHETKILRENGIIKFENFIVAYREDKVLEKLVEIVVDIVCNPEIESLIEANYPVLNSRGNEPPDFFLEFMKEQGKPLPKDCPVAKSIFWEIELIVDMIRTFYVANTYGYRLLTDRLEARDLLKKVVTLLTKKGFKTPRFNSSMQKSHELGISVFEYTLPDVSNLSFEEILELREELKDLLENYRLKMWELARFIELEPCDVNFESAVKEVIENRVVPEVKDLINKLKQSRNKFLRSVAEKIIFLPPITILASSINNFPYILFFSTLAVLGFEIYDFIDFNKKIVKSNGLSFILKVGKGTLEKTLF